MQEKLYHYWTICRRHLDQIAILTGLVFLGLVFLLRISESPNAVVPPPGGADTPMQQIFPNRWAYGEDAYNRAINFMQLEADIEDVENEKYTILLKFNPFDKKHALPESEIEKQITETYNQARAAMSAGNYQRAAELATQVIELDPSRYGAVQILKRANQALETNQ